MKVRFAEMSPEDGGTDGDQTANTPKLSADALTYFKSIGIDHSEADEATIKLADTVWKARGKELAETKRYRERAQLAEKSAAEANAKLSKLDIENLVGEIDDTTKGKVAGLIDTARRVPRLEEALDIVAEAGLSLTPEIMDLVKAGPEATRAAVTAILKHNSAPIAKDDDSDDALIARIAQKLGVGADEIQRKTNNDKPKERLTDKYDKSANTPTAKMVEMFRDAARGTKKE